MRHNLLLTNLYFIPGAFYCFYKCWHLFQQQQVIVFWILSHLKLLELLNSQGQHWVMFLTEKSYFIFHQKNSCECLSSKWPFHSITSNHLSILFLNIHISIFLNTVIFCVPFRALFYFFWAVIDNIFPILLVVKALKTAWTSSPAPSHLTCVWPVSLYFHASSLPEVTCWTSIIPAFSLLSIRIVFTSFQDYMHFSSLIMYLWHVLYTI